MTFMKRLLCKILGHEFNSWRPRHGRFGYRHRKCRTCGLLQIHDIRLDTITDISR